MTSRFDNLLSPRELGDYGRERIKFIAFEAVTKLWRRREAQGLKQRELAERIGRDPGWVSKKLRGPGNWTLKTLGEFVEALQGELELIVHAIEDPVSPARNYHAYAEYELPQKPLMANTNNKAVAATTVRAPINELEKIIRSQARQ
jgi:transcriptional regulator with XRE-family HTH domain